MTAVSDALYAKSSFHDFRVTHRPLFGRTSTGSYLDKARRHSLKVGVSQSIALETRGDI